MININDKIVRNHFGYQLDDQLWVQLYMQLNNQLATKLCDQLYWIIDNKFSNLPR
jgi:hypothetical protein